MARNLGEIVGAAAQPALVCGLHAPKAVAPEDDSLEEQLRKLESEIGALCEVRDEVTRALHEEQLEQRVVGAQGRDGQRALRLRKP